MWQILVCFWNFLKTPSLWLIKSLGLEPSDLRFGGLTNFIPGGLEGKASACNAGDLASIPGWGRSPEEGNGNPLQYSCLGNPIARGTWWATVHGVNKESDVT